MCAIYVCDGYFCEANHHPRHAARRSNKRSNPEHPQLRLSLKNWIRQKNLNSLLPFGFNLSDAVTATVTNQRTGMSYR